MYKYDSYDQQLVQERANQFLGQVQRRLDGEITEGEFKPLRLQNGLYMQLHAYMLRVAIPYGMLSATQLRKLAHIARTYDKGYAHFTTRQNVQFNWPKLEDMPAILKELASVEMHAIQTSGNCIRNTTSDQFAGVTPDELEDPRPYCEIIRQWSTLHPEFAFLPRKFKIAVTACPDVDRAAIRLHDIGIQLVKNGAGELGFKIFVGGGLGRTPLIAQCIREYLPKADLLAYLESILRVYNQFGRRDNKYKARIKILLAALGRDEFARRVEEEWEASKGQGLELTDAELERVAAHFVPPKYESIDGASDLAALALKGDKGFRYWVRSNVAAHKVPGYCAVTLSLKADGIPPGDVSDTQLDAIAKLSENFGFGEVGVTHVQNVVLRDVRIDQLEALYAELGKWDLASANVGKLTDSICCPGLDFCALANARSIPLALDIRKRFDDLDYLHDLGDIQLKMSGCINACGHHHVGHIGILGIDKQGTEFYQILLGGSADHDASVGKILGRALPQEEVVPALEKLLNVYVQSRNSSEESFLATYRRLGPKPFKEVIYANH